MNHSPRVSVIIPAFNSEKYIASTIQSVCDQTYSDWEMIVIDDGSTDTTADIVRAFVDPRIRLIQKTNGGTSSARNLAIIKSHAEFIQFLDADDLILPKKLALQVEILDRQPAIDVVYASFRYLYDNYCSINPPEWMREPTDEPFRELVKGSMFPPNAALVRRRLIEREDLFDESLRTGEDWDFWLRLARKGATFLFHNECLALYRQHTDSKTNNLEPWRKAHVLILERFRDRVDDEEELAHIRWHYYTAYNYVLWALALLLNSKDTLAREAFENAYKLNPELGCAFDDLALLVAEHAIHLDGQGTDKQVLTSNWFNCVQSSLPSTYPSRRLILEARLLYWHAKAFEAYEFDKDRDVRKYLWQLLKNGGVKHINLGTVSIYLQSIIGRQKWRHIKGFWR